MISFALSTPSRRISPLRSVIPHVAQVAPFTPSLTCLTSAKPGGAERARSSPPASTILSSFFIYFSMAGVDFHRRAGALFTLRSAPDRRRIGRKSPQRLPCSTARWGWDAAPQWFAGRIGRISSRSGDAALHARRRPQSVSGAAVSEVPGSGSRWEPARGRTANYPAAGGAREGPEREPYDGVRPAVRSGKNSVRERSLTAAGCRGSSPGAISAPAVSVREARSSTAEQAVPLIWKRH